MNILKFFKLFERIFKSEKVMGWSKFFDFFKGKIDKKRFRKSKKSPSLQRGYPLRPQLRRGILWFKEFKTFIVQQAALWSWKKFIKFFKAKGQKSLHEKQSFNHSARHIFNLRRQLEDPMVQRIQDFYCPTSCLFTSKKNQ